VTGMRARYVLSAIGGALLVFWPFLALVTALFARFGNGIPRRWPRILVLIVTVICWSLPLFINGEKSEGVLAVLQVLAVIGVGIASRQLFSEEQVSLSALSTGIAIGLSLTLIAAGIELFAVGSGRARLLSDHPNLLAHQSILLATLSMTLGYRRSSLVAAAAALGIAEFSGSRSAVGAGLLVSAAYLLASTIPSRGISRPLIRWRHVIGLIVLSSIATSVDFAAGGRFSGLILPAGITRNLVTASEMPRASAWTPLGVTIDKARVAAPIRGAKVFGLGRTDEAPWSRLQQPISLQARATYTASVYIAETHPTTRPGYQGWGQTPQGPLELRVFLSNGRAEGSLRGPGQLLGVRVEPVGDTWVRLIATFRYEGRSPLEGWMFGPAPDQSAGGSGGAVFAGIQLEAGESATSYEPTRLRARAEVQSSNSSRKRYLKAAISGFLERPWFGHGEQAFTSYVAKQDPSQEAPGHAHSLVGQVSFARGVLGLIGLICLLILLAPTSSSVVAWLPMSAALVLNMFDYTLFYSGLIYPLALTVGTNMARARQVSGPSSKIDRL
jgi:hypothetical protein